MRMTWAGIVLSLFCGLAWAESEAQGPLARLPSSPGPHLAKIQALGAHAWLDLGAPKPDPKWGPAPGRSYTNKMALSPRLKAAFLYGEGVHGHVKADGHYMDDLWAYDIHAHAWICLHPGSDTKNIKLQLNEHGFECDESGRPVPVAQQVHGYEMTEYLPGLEKFMFLPCPGAYWRKSLGAKRPWAERGGKGIVGKVAHPWFYDIASGQWERDFARIPGGLGTGFCGALFWSPTLKQTLYYQRGNHFWAYDHAAKAWSQLATKGVKADAPDYEGVSCHDTKGDRIFVINRKGTSFPLIYDVKSNTWTDPQAEVPEGLKGGFGSASGTMTYDSVNDVVVVLTNPKKGGALFVYDVKANRWESRESEPGGRNAFYDPDLNAHFFYTAGDSRPAGNIKVYRYKPAGK